MDLRLLLRGTCSPFRSAMPLVYHVYYLSRAGTEWKWQERVYAPGGSGSQTHQQALRALANRLVGILDGCLRHRHFYREEVAWPLFVSAA